MKLKWIAISIVFSVLCIGCQSKKMEDKKPAIDNLKTAAIPDTIPYIIAQNYFVKNTVKAIENPKIETEAAFNSYFGAATTMGKNGKPTAIDFTKDYVIAVVLPNTNVSTTIKPVSLKSGKDNSVVFEYRVTLGNKQAYTSRPFLLLFVDKKFDGNVRLKRVE
jgi:hypothetical protein